MCSFLYLTTFLHSTALTRNASETFWPKTVKNGTFVFGKREKKFFLHKNIKQFYKKGLTLSYLVTLKTLSNTADQWKKLLRGREQIKNHLSF